MVPSKCPRFQLMSQLPLQLMVYYTPLQKKNILKYANDEYDHFLYLLAAESKSDNCFASSRLDLAVP